MSLRYLVLACLTALVALTGVYGTEVARAQDDGSFLARVAPLARQSQRETTVPASVTLAQAAWETGRGVHSIGDANNFFGIKAAASADGSVNIGPIATGWVWAWTREWTGSQYVARRERFRQYRSMEDSFRDHGLLLATNPRYASAMLAVDDPREFARRIAAAGYATSPTYAEDLIRIMDMEDLYRFDLRRDDAEFLGQSEYQTATPGGIMQIYFDVRNSGFGTWSPAAGYYLASANDQRLGASGRQELDQLVTPGRIKRWAITMVAPQAPGHYHTAWQFKHGEASFGPELYIDVEVKAPPAETDWRPWIVGGGAMASAVLLVLWRHRRKSKKDPPHALRMGVLDSRSAPRRRRE